MTKRKSWVDEYHEELGYYDYKGRKVACKTEKEKYELAENYEKPEITEDVFLKCPKYTFILLFSDSEESIDNEINFYKNIEKKQVQEKWYIPSSTKKPKRKDRDRDLMKFLQSLVDTGLKKRPLIAKMRGQFPKLSSAVICNFVNKQLKLKVVAIDTTFKTKPVIIKGKYWRSV